MTEIHVRAVESQGNGLVTEWLDVWADDVLLDRVVETSCRHCGQTVRQKLVGQIETTETPCDCPLE